MKTINVPEIIKAVREGEIRVNYCPACGEPLRRGSHKFWCSLYKKSTQ